MSIERNTTERAEDLARLLGLRVLFPCVGRDDAPRLADEPPEVGEEALSLLTPEQRDRAHNVALRRLAAQVLYALDASSLPTPRAAIEAFLSRVEGLGPIMQERVIELALPAFERRVEADAEFGALAPEWPPHRQPPMDRAILRLAHFEVTTGRTHGRIAINEAVELARFFSTEKSPSFINALLDKVLRRLETQAIAQGIAQGIAPGATSGAPSGGA